MKKFLLLAAAGLFTVNAGYTYPNVDMSIGGAPFQLLQQQNFQKMELNDYKRFKDADERYVETRLENPKKLQEEYEVQNLKKPAKIQLGQTTSQENNDSDMQLIQDNGKIQIKRIDN